MTVRNILITETQLKSLGHLDHPGWHLFWEPCEDGKSNANHGSGGVVIMVNKKSRCHFSRVPTPFPQKVVGVQTGQRHKGGVVLASCYRQGASMKAGEFKSFMQGIQQWAVRLAKQGLALVMGGDFNLDVRDQGVASGAEKEVVKAVLENGGCFLASREGVWENIVTRRPYGPRQGGQGGSQIDWVLAQNLAKSVNKLRVMITHIGAWESVWESDSESDVMSDLDEGEARGAAKGPRNSDHMVISAELVVQAMLERRSGLPTKKAWNLRRIVSDPKMQEEFATKLEANASFVEALRLVHGGLGGAAVDLCHIHSLKEKAMDEVAMEVVGLAKVNGRSKGWWHKEVKMAHDRKQRAHKAWKEARRLLAGGNAGDRQTVRALEGRYKALP